ncbi:MAG: hypothetical protein C0483_04890 [Pirellula sp.]|nr:hypothetical protein [Pirellula sp.]
MKLAITLTSLVFIFLSTTSAQAEAIRDFLSRHCFECHGNGAAEGNLAMDRLSTNRIGAADAATWGRIVTRLEAGEMPPPDHEARLKPIEANAALQWMKAQLAAEAFESRAGERTRMRRLNRLEYENTVHDLLHVDVALQDLLPVDDRVEGFDTGTDALSVSPVHIQRYIEAADVALRAATMRGERPETVTTRFSYDHRKEQLFFDQRRYGGMLLRRDGELQFFAEADKEHPAFLQQFSDLTRKRPGRYRVRVAARTLNGDGERTVLAIRGATKKQKAGNDPLGWFDAPPDVAEVFEVERLFLPGDSIVVEAYRLNDLRRQRGLSQYPPEDGAVPVGLALGVAWVEVEGPLVEAWPPIGHLRLFGDLAMASFKSLPANVVTPGTLLPMRKGDQLTPVSTQPEADAKRLLQAFLGRAYRRPVDAEDVAPYLAIVQRHLDRSECFEAALVAAYRAVLCSPEFLFLVEPAGTLDDHALATRLSYFLWRTAPDDELRAVADRSELHRPEVLKRETERLLASPRSKAFVDDFLDQWLHLREITATQPDKLLFPEFYVQEGGRNFKDDGLLVQSMLDETRLFFGDLLKHDSSLLHLIDSDFTYLNHRLAAFYQLPEPEGSTMRRVSLPAGSPRGGVLTQASILKVTANGTRTSPVVRGTWVLENILGRKSLPPPPDAGAIDPDTRGSMTIREQLAKHQSNAGCASCHRQIDPPGFALESFDPAGQWRDVYRTTDGVDLLKEKRPQPGAATAQPLRGRDVLGPMTYLPGRPVDSTGSLLNGERFAGPQEFKKLLLAEPHAVTRCLASKLVTFATGRATEPGDLLALDAVVEDAASHKYGLRSLVHAVVQSDLFRNK